ncbi:uncharacterized protein VP01_12819g1, partial [Puccinia sorghi]
PTWKPPSTNTPLPPLVSRHKSNSKLPSIPSHPMNNVPYRKGIDPEHHALVADGSKSQFITAHLPSTEVAEREVLAWAAVQRFRKFSVANQPIKKLMPCLLGLEAPFPWALPVHFHIWHLENPHLNTSSFLAYTANCHN